MDRVKIAEEFKKKSKLRTFLGVIFIYLPILVTIPFIILGILLVKLHLKNMGASNIKSYWDFVPSWISFRYHYENQITYESGTNWTHLRYYRFYWIFNCNIYCPMSIAAFKYMAYLISIVENWWCPFDHDKKSEYKTSAIDKSYWHLYEKELNKLHPYDRENIIWNEDAKPK